jgi:hypothetical protein
MSSAKVAVRSHAAAPRSVTRKTAEKVGREKRMMQYDYHSKMNNSRAILTTDETLVNRPGQNAGARKNGDND